MWAMATEFIMNNQETLLVNPSYLYMADQAGARIQATVDFSTPKSTALFCLISEDVAKAHPMHPLTTTQRGI
jgi:hypothetical protein